jgi:REP element-mobilizing transposase RayT
MVDSWWNFIPARWPTVVVDEMIVMPNHLHAIIHMGASPEPAFDPGLSRIIQWFKIRTTYDYTLGVKTEGWPRFPGKLWQERYYDHIIRSDAALEKVRAYMAGNPSRWANDEYNVR